MEHLVDHMSLTCVLMGSARYIYIVTHRHTPSKLSHGVVDTKYSVTSFGQVVCLIFPLKVTNSRLPLHSNIILPKRTELSANKSTNLQRPRSHTCENHVRHLGQH